MMSASAIKVEVVERGTVGWSRDARLNPGTGLVVEDLTG